MKPQIRNLRWSQNQKHKKKVYSQNQELKETLKLKPRTQRKLEIRIKPKSRTLRKLGFDNFERKSKHE
jgi:hypothetical protein